MLTQYSLVYEYIGVCIYIRMYFEAGATLSGKHQLGEREQGLRVRV